MNEQQRVLSFVLIAVVIVVGWQLLSSKWAPPPPTITVQPSSLPPSLASGAVEPAPMAANLAASELVAAKKGASALGIPPSEMLTPFKTPLLEGEISNLGPALSKIALVRYQERAAEPQPVSLVAREFPELAYQAQLLWHLGGGANATPSWQIPAFKLVKAEAGTVEFVGNLVKDQVKAVDIQVKIKPRLDTYALDYELVLANLTKETLPVDIGLRLQLAQTAKKASLFAPPQDQLFGICGNKDEVKRKQLTDLSGGPWQAETLVDWAGLDRQYFVISMLPQPVTDPGICRLTSLNPEQLRLDFSWPAKNLVGGQRLSKNFTLFAGPKKTSELAKVDKVLEEVIDYNIWHIPLGFLARPMVFVLNLFQGLTNSWGVAIMLLTLLVKLLLFPVTYKSVVSTRKVQLLKPELDRLKQQFANDKERQHLEQLKLFREKGVNPLGGCLPMLLQMPVWFALYRTLWTAVDLYQQPFLWLPDLTAKEPLPFLALALGVLTFIQQKITPTGVDSSQAKMMLYLMPMMLTVFMIALPSGLVLYIFVNSVLTILQQLAINRQKVKV